MKCKKCEHEIPVGAKFCPACGEPAGDACPQCGRGDIPEEARFCPDCGADLKIDWVERARKKKQEQERIQAHTKEEERKKKKKKRLVILGGSLGGVLVLTGIVLWAVFVYPEIRIKSKARDFVKAKYAFDMVTVAGSSFEMGSNNGNSDEKWVHTVRVSTFKMGRTEVTQAQWQAVMEYNPSYFRGADRPVENVSWDDIQIFLKKLNQLTGLTYRLPTEAEWEFAAGGGVNNRTVYAGVDSEGALGLYAWYASNSSKTHPVATKRPNSLGLYDMTGNVFEWCHDWYKDRYWGCYNSLGKEETCLDPTGPYSGSYRVYRGGSCYESAQYCRVACRRYDSPIGRDNDLGFRLVLVP